MATEREDAFAKVNLCLFLGPTRADGRHELVTLFQSVTLADELMIGPLAHGQSDRVVCHGVTGTNLVAQALGALRAAGWGAPPVLIRIHKRIPIAGGLGGGSADAAALLRHAPRLAPVEQDVVMEIAVGLGADVPSQLEPGASLGTGAGEVLEPVEVQELGLVVVPQPFSLATSDAYREADRLGLGRSAEELAALAVQVRTALANRGPLPDELLLNDLQPAAVSLAPPIEEAIDLTARAGARPAMLCGSGPTVIGVFPGSQGAVAAIAAAATLRRRYPGATAVRPVRAGTGARAAND